MKIAIQQRRWISVLLVWIIVFFGIQHDFSQGTDLLINPYQDHLSVNIIERQQEAFMDVADTAEITQVMLQRLTNRCGRVNRWEDTSLLLGGEITGFTGCGTRIYLTSCRIENIYVRSHALIMAYIHCQDGEKTAVSFGMFHT